MRIFRLLLIASAMFMTAPARAGDEERPQNTEPPKDQNQIDRVARPQRKAVKLSPSIHVAPPQPDESSDMRRIAPKPSESPLQDVPALKDVPPSGVSPGGR